MYDFNFNFDITHWQWPCESFNIQLITNRVIIIALRVAGQCDAMRCFFFLCVIQPPQGPRCRLPRNRSIMSDRTNPSPSCTHPHTRNCHHPRAAGQHKHKRRAASAAGARIEFNVYVQPVLFFYSLGVCPCAFFSCNCRQWPSGRHTDSALCK